MDLLRRPKLEYTLSHLAHDKDRKLKRTLKWFDVAVLGVSMSVGAGIFSVGARVIIQEAGPSAVISFLITAVVCALAAMCYAEFSSTIPVAGSAYVFSYSAIGELVAWIIGWNLILELFMSAAVIAKYWSIYLYTSLRLLGVENLIPPPVEIGGLKVDWVVIVAITVFTVLLVRGTKLSARVISIFVVIKIGVVLFVVIAGIQFFDLANLSPFIPESRPAPNIDTAVWTQSLFSWVLGFQPEKFGVMGIFAGAAIVFFAFIGFDNAATAAEETINPRKNVPLGLMVGVAIVSVLYILTALITTGMVSLDEYAKYATTHPEATPSLATAFEINGHSYVGAIAATGAFVGLTTVIFVALLGLSRVVFAMSRDGLFPRRLSVTSKFDTPARIQILSGVLVTIVAVFTDIDALGEIINIGTLSAFIIVSFAIPLLRKRKDIQQLHRNEETYKVPFSPVLPIISGTICIWLTFNLATATWIAFIIWVTSGLVFYFAFSRHNAVLARHPEHIHK